MRYILGVDQSTSGTKALLFDESGKLVERRDRPHRQIISRQGWISHNPSEIYTNTLGCVERLLLDTGIERGDICGVGISNQRETALVWNRETGEPVCDAVVWQCSRGESVCERLEKHKEKIALITGLQLSPYFSAAKIAWILENHDCGDPNRLCAGTIDSWLVNRLTGGKVFQTDYSNASRTQLFDIQRLCWDDGLCGLFGISPQMLPTVTDSNGQFGETDFEGLLPAAVPIRAVLGDSNGALFGQGCTRKGLAKATYGTGSSVMLHTGSKPVLGEAGLVTSLAWGIDGRVEYVLEGNINYTGAVITWLVKEVGLLSASKEAGPVAAAADPADTTYLVPAFSGLGAPYWNSSARAVLCGMGRGTGKAEIVKAAEESIGYQIADVVKLMEQETGEPIAELRADGGPTGDVFLMQTQSDILGFSVQVSTTEELSGLGAAYLAGMTLGIYPKELPRSLERKAYIPQKDDLWRKARYRGWKEAVKKTWDDEAR